MEMKGFFLSLLLAPATGFAAEPLTTAATPIEPTQAVQLAAAAAPQGVPGIFSIHVRAIGHQDGFTYLNSELDYRDQRNLTIAIAPDAARKLQAHFGADLSVALDGKDIVVAGEARRVTVWFSVQGRRTNDYYYQTHVMVTDPKQITISPQEG